jgi:hypothetical protein
MARQRRTLADQLADLSTLDRGNRTINYTTQPMVGVTAENLEANAVTEQALADGAVAVAKLEQGVQDSINQALADSASAAAAAGTAQTSANGKNTVYYTDTLPTGGTYVAGDTAFIRPAVGQPITAQYQWDGTAWQPVTLDHEVIASIDLGKVTVGELDGIYIKAKSLYSDSLVVGGGNNIIPDPSGQVPDNSARVIAKSNADPAGAVWSQAVEQNIRGWYHNPSAATNIATNDTHLILTNRAATGYSYSITVTPGLTYQISYFAAKANGVALTNPTLRMKRDDGTNVNVALTAQAMTTSPVSYRWTWVCPADIVALDLEVETDKGATATLVRYHSISMTPMVGGTLITDGGVQTNHLTAGSVTAGKLESQLVLASDIVAGPPASNHALMNANGFRVLGLNDAGIPSDVIRMGTDTGDYIGVVDPATGTLVASVGATGDAAFSSVDAAEDVYVAGDSLTDRLDAAPQGLVAWASRYTDGQYYAGTTKHPYLHLQVDGLKAGRAYVVRTSPITLKSDAASSVATAYLFIGPGTRSATVDDPVYAFAESVQEPWSTGQRSMVSFNRLLTPTSDAPLSFLLGYGIFGGGGGRCKIVSAGDRPVIMTIEDIGLAMPQTGEWRDGTSDAPAGGGGGGETAPPPVVKNYDQTWNATGLRSFTGSGSTYAYNTGYMYSGLSPAGYGDMSSMATFPSLTSALSGATITGIWIYVYYDFWYYGSGGTAYIGFHGQSSLTSTAPTRTYAFATSPSWPRAAGRWIKMSSSTYGGWQSGVHRGITLGGHGGGYTEYGYAHNPKIRITYTK